MSGLSPEDAELYQRCDEALYFLWDPIGVRGVAQARDEYSSYVPRVFALVRSGDRQGLIDYLAHAMDGMGIDTDPSAADEAVRYVFESDAWLSRGWAY